MNEKEQKICSKCKRTLPCSEFRIRRNRVTEQNKNPLRSWCRECEKQERKEYLKRDSVKRRHSELQRKFYMENKEEIRESRKVYLAREDVKQRCKTYKKEYARLESSKKRNSDYRKTDAGKRAVRQAHENFVNTVSGKLVSIKMSAKSRGLDVEFSKDEFFEFMENNKVCFYCGRNDDEVRELNSFLLNYCGNNSRVLKMKKSFPNGHLRAFMMGLDRTDCFGGYNNNNCVRCCVMCNNARGWMISSFDYKTLAKNVINNIIKVCQMDGYEGGLCPEATN